MSLKLKSNFFSGTTELCCEKDSVRKKHSERELRECIIRDFYNGKPIMTEEEGDEENLETLTNHLLGYAAAHILEIKLYALWSTSNKIVDVDVLRGDLDQTETESAFVNEYINEAIYNTSKFGSFWRSVSGEIVISGRAACVYPEDSDWCPKLHVKMLFPDSTGSDASEMTYAFAPRELTIMQLKELMSDEEEDDDLTDEQREIDDTLKEGDEVNLDKPLIKKIIKQIESNIEKDSVGTAGDHESEDREATNTDGFKDGNKTKASVWYYYEVRFDKALKSKVVDITIFTDNFITNDDGGKAKVIAHLPAFYKRPSEWMHLFVIDASIGGEKKFSGSKGVCEIKYNSDIDAEELMNRWYDGEKLRAVPRFQDNGKGSTEGLMGWDPARDPIVPDNLAPFSFPNGGGGLSNPMALLQQNSAAISGSGFSNTGRDQQLRTQAVRQAGDDQATQGSRIADAYKSLDILFREIVRRFLIGKVDPGSPGYEEIKWFRYKLKAKGIKRKELAKQKFGFFENIKVKCVRSSLSGESDLDLAAAELLMQNINNYPAAVRPFIIRRFTTLITHDPEFADKLTEILPKISSAQRVTAESEFEQIARDSVLGIDTPLGVEDVHQDHMPIHLKQQAVLIRRGELKPWTREDAVTFAGLQNHGGLHLDELLRNKTTVAEGQSYAQDMAKLAAQGDGLLQDLEAREAEEGGANAAQIEQDLKIAESERKDREQDRKDFDTKSIAEQRKVRQDQVGRKHDQDFVLKKEKLDRDTNQQPQE